MDTCRIAKKLSLTCDQRGNRRDLWVLWVDAADMIVTIVGTSQPGWSEVEDRTEVSS